MCRKHALAATALVGLAAATLGASPALAFGWGHKADPAPAAKTAPATAQAAKPAVPAPPVHASAQERAMAERMDPLARSAFWAREADADPTDAVAGTRLAAALRAMDRGPEAQDAIERVLVLQPNNVEALLEQARDFIAQNQGFYAIAPAKHAQGLAPHDWRAPSLLAVALEQAQRDDEALAAHRQALALAPANPTAMSNLAMFYAGHGQAAEAERLLRQAAADPAAPMQVRQNLALVLGLNGKLAEAEQLARRDLPPAMVANNLAYLRAATATASATPRNWNAMRDPSATN